jgi:disulfide bond formation protein DsbB/mono/diheme cytochrome c family protein
MLPCRGLEPHRNKQLMILIALASIVTVSLLILASGAVIALAVRFVSRFFDSNLPSAAVMAEFNTRYAAELAEKRMSKEVPERKPVRKMEKVKRDASAASEEVDDELEHLPSNGFLDLLGKYSRYLALLAAWTATCGSLFMSEVLGWVPCLLCWYQRIAMYPLSIILAVGILRRDKGLPKYALALAIPGACLSIYHYAIQKVPGLEVIAPCRIGVPCTSDYINWLGFITIPFLALTTFLIIIFMSFASTLAPAEEGLADEEPDDEDGKTATETPARRAPVLPVAIIIAAVVLSFVVAGILYNRSTPAAAASTDVTSTQIVPTPDSAAAARGKVLFQQNCAECHGASGEGALAGVKPLIQSAVLRNNSDAQVLAFLQAGRATNDPHNVSGIAMPAKGGHATLTDANLADLVAYMRTLVK